MGLPFDDLSILCYEVALAGFFAFWVYDKIKTVRKRRYGRKHKGTMAEAARVSKMLWDARELLSMYGDSLYYQTGKRDERCDQTVKEIDAYRTKQRW